MAAPNNAYSIGQLIASLGLDDAEFQRGMKEVNASMARTDAAMKTTSQRLSASMDKIGQKMAKVGKQMTMMVTLPIVGVGVAAFKMQKDFEASMSKIEGLVGVARDQVKAWEKDILRLAPAVGKAPVELADAMFFITSAGIKGAEAMEVLEMSAKASAAGLGETKTVADIVTSAMNAYGKEVVNAAQATDILVAAVREGKAEAPDLAASMGAVLPIASAMGVQFGEVGAAIAAMTRTGSNSAMAVTQLKAILSGTLAPAENAEEAMTQMGISSAKLRKTIKEDGLISALLLLKEATIDYGVEGVAKVYPNIRALLGVLDLIGANVEDTARIFGELTDATGANEKAFDAAAQTTQHKWNKATTQVKTTLTILGTTLKDILIPAIENITERIRKATEWWEGLNEAQKTNIIRIAGLTAAMGPLLIVFGKLLQLVAANPYVALAVALVGITMAIVGMVRHSKAAENTLVGVARAEQRVTDAVEEQHRQLRSLMIVARDQNISLAERQRAVDKLNKVLPDYNGYIEEETGHLKANNTALDDYLKKLEQKIRFAVYEDEYTTALKEQKEAIENLDKARQDHLNTEVRSQAHKYNLYDAVVQAEGMVEHYITVLDDLKKKMAEIGIPVPSGMETPETPGGGGGGGGGSVFDVRAFIDTNALKKAADEADDIIADIIKESDEMMNGNQADRIKREQELTEALKKQALERFRYEDQLMIEQRAKRIELAQQWIQNTANAVGAIQTLIEAQKQAELTAAGDNAAARESIEKDYYKKQKKWSIAQAIINGAIAVSNLIANVPGSVINPATWVGIGIAAASTAAQVAVIASQSFAKGGVVYGETLATVGEYPGARSNPEVIAPLDKLKTLIQPSGMDFPSEIRLRAEGRDLVGVINVEQMKRRTF